MLVQNVVTLEVVVEWVYLADMQPFNFYYKVLQHCAG